MFVVHAMCEAQVDFGDILVKRSHGGEEVWHEFAQVCQYETKECLCEALIGIFKFIGGVPLRILFGNMSSAVVHIEEHGNRKLTEMFMRFTVHRFKAEFCNGDSPHEKGNVENNVGYIRRNYLLPPPENVDVELFNADMLEVCMGDLEREHYMKGEQTAKLFSLEEEPLIPLPRESFRVFTLEKVKTDKNSFIRHDSNKYSTSPEYAKCEMWLEIGAYELRILNGKYEHTAAHGRESQPVIDFENYIGELSRKPRAFLSPPYFAVLPEAVQKHLKNCTYAELKKMLVTLVPIIKDGKIGDAAAVLELTPVRDTEEFKVAYRALTEDRRPIESLTPEQPPYVPKLDPYSALMGGES